MHRTCGVLAVWVLASCGLVRSPEGLHIDLGPTIQALGSDDLATASAAEDKILALGEPALPALDSALRREPQEVRVAVVEVLGSMRGEESRTLLARTLRDDDADRVRADAAFELRMFPNSPETEGVLVTALGDPAPEVRRKTALALGAVCRTRDCVERVTTSALADPSAGVWWGARTSLVRLRATDRGGMARLVDGAIREQAPAVLAGGEATYADRAALLLADIGDDRGVSRLEQLAVTGEPMTRQQAVLALGAVGGASAVTVLRVASQDPRVSVAARLALRQTAARQVPGASAALAEAERQAPRVRPPR